MMLSKICCPDCYPWTSLFRIDGITDRGLMKITCVQCGNRRWFTVIALDLGDVVEVRT